MSKPTILTESSFDIIEEATRYFLIAKDKPRKTIAIGGRDRLKMVCESIPANMVICTAGDEKKCLILIDYTSKELSAIIEKYKKLIN